MGLFGRVARKKPYLNKINFLKRLKHPKEMLRKPSGFWNTVVWSEESKFNLFGSNERIMVCRSRDEELDPRCTVPTLKYEGSSLMI